MAIARDTKADLGRGTSSPFTTANYTCSGSNRLLFLCLGTDTASAAPTATFNGVSMTQITTIATGAADRLTILYLLAPTTSAATFVITFAGSAVEVGAISYNGCAQSGVPDSQNTGSASGTNTLSITNTTVADNCWALFFFGDSSSTSGWTYTNLTEQVQLNGGSAGDVFADSNGVIHPAGSFTGTVSLSGGSQDFSGIQVSFAPFTNLDTQEWRGCYPPPRLYNNHVGY